MYGRYEVKSLGSPIFYSLLGGATPETISKQQVGLLIL